MRSEKHALTRWEVADVMEIVRQTIYENAMEAERLIKRLPPEGRQVLDRLLQNLEAARATADNYSDT